MSEVSATTVMPKYKCHKEVWALKIAGVAPADAQGNAELIPVDTRYAPIKVDAAYLQRHQPTVGGYYVVYKDGYRSFSPGSEFEDGYTLIS